MAFSAPDFADDTDFERFTLDRLGPHRVQIGEPGAIFHDEANQQGGERRRNITVSLGSADAGGRGREELRQALRPVGFGAAYKILDLLIEHVLRANGVSTIRTFTQKTKSLATRPAALPPPLDGRTDLWDRLAKSYVVLQDARHAVTHRRAQITLSGDLEVYDDARNVTDVVTNAELTAFAAAVHVVAEAVIAGDADPRRLGIADWYANGLAARHGLGLLAAPDPDAGRRLLITDLAPLERGALQLDVARARGIIAGQQPGVWDLELRAGERVFVGRWEDVPSHADKIDFHPASPPPWLSEQAA
jgi:hypothetical protein